LFSLFKLAMSSSLSPEIKLFIRVRYCGYWFSYEVPNLGEGWKNEVKSSGNPAKEVFPQRQ